MSEFSEFVECDTCRAKVGTPTLCYGCFENRKTICNYEDKIARCISISQDAYLSHYNMVQDMLEVLNSKKGDCNERA